MMGGLFNSGMFNHLAGGVNDVVTGPSYPSSTTEVVVSHDPKLNWYWIHNGTDCWVLTPDGLGGPMSVKPSSLIRDHEGRLVGTALGSELTTIPFVLKTNTLNMNSVSMVLSSRADLFFLA